jgi:putative FmdB family regulatory protein
MPLFEYTCLACGATLEHLQHAGEPDPRRCGPRCAQGPGGHPDRGFDELRRALSVPGGELAGHTLRERPTPGDLAGAGFTTYARTPKGLRRLDGPGR